MEGPKSFEISPVMFPRRSYNRIYIKILSHVEKTHKTVTRRGLVLQIQRVSSWNSTQILSLRLAAFPPGYAFMHVKFLASETQGSTDYRGWSHWYYVHIDERNRDQIQDHLLSNHHDYPTYWRQHGSYPGGRTQPENCETAWCEHK